MTTAQSQAARRNLTAARRAKWIARATNHDLRTDGREDAMAELARRESPTYYAKDDPRRARWESQPEERLCRVTVKGQDGSVLLREKWLTDQAPEQIRENLVGEQFGTFDRHEVTVRVEELPARKEAKP